LRTPISVLGKLGVALLHAHTYSLSMMLGNHLRDFSVDFPDAHTQFLGAHSPALQ
jgi:hypothetical protein